MLLLCTLTSIPTLVAQELIISAELSGIDKVAINISYPENFSAKSIRLLRSTYKLSPLTRDKIQNPITEFILDDLPASNTFQDTFTAHNITYYYLAILISPTGNPIFSNRVEVTIPNSELPSLTNPELFIDKICYFLEVRDHGKPVKRYPVALGQDPVTRKLHQDFATTPEGIYRVTHRIPNSTFFHAWEIDYPNSSDRIRYALKKSLQEIPSGKKIGGDIQIHGQLRSTWSIEMNWTWGCISLRNADVDELFDQKKIKAGIPVYIVGKNITREDLPWLERSWSHTEIKGMQEQLFAAGFYKGKLDGILGPQTKSALGLWQIKKGYPLTCEPDSRTVQELVKQAQK